jgi:hypothetical protein
MTQRTRLLSADPFLEPSEIAYEYGVVGWVSHEIAPTKADAIAYAYSHGAVDADSPLSATDVLMRLQSEIEAKINGGDDDGNPQWVQCTKRARRPVAYWRVEKPQADQRWEMGE